MSALPIAVPKSEPRGGAVVQRIVWAVGIALILFVWGFPILWTLATSLKERTDIFVLPPKVIFSPTIAHYLTVVTTRSIVPNLGTSLIIASASTAIALLVSVPAGYAYARLAFRGRRVMSYYTLLMQMAPPIGLIIPYFVIFSRLKWTDTVGALVLVNLTLTVPFSIWLLIVYFTDIPPELEEAAFIDGAHRMQAFTWVILPQARGGIAVTAIFAFINAWNEFLFAVLLSGSQVQTVTVTMYGFLTAEEAQWGNITAAAVLAMLPVIALAIIAQRNILQGLTLGAVK
ncbi:MAG: carbohydrate ABC transporter permease [Chloroflexi bacterium]|nr:carbohydrate ABC transporter permease [Chloroflexota bacterium]